MIDLYKQYGLKAYEADQKKIRQALSRPPYRHNGTVEYVLLHKGRKSVYDRTHDTLSLVGEIRSRLELTDTAYWGSTYEDFNRVTKRSQNTKQPKKSTSSTQTGNETIRTRAPHVKKRFTYLRGDLIVVLILSIFVSSYFLRDDSNTNNLNSRPAPSSSYSKPAPKPKQLMHVTAKALNVREQPNAQSKIIGRYSKYQDVYKISSANTGWAYVRAKESGVEGYVSTKYIDKGNGWSAWLKVCRANGIVRPKNSGVLAKSGSGKHALIVKNSPGTDALVKLKDMSGGTVISMYVRAGQTARINVPEGRYQFQYATGKDFSRSCGRFLVDMVASKDPSYTNFIAEKRYNGTAYMVQTYTLQRVAHGNFRPRSMSASDF